MLEIKLNGQVPYKALCLLIILNWTVLNDFELLINGPPICHTSVPTLKLPKYTAGERKPKLVDRDKWFLSLPNRDVQKEQMEQLREKSGP
jgi:hypothetical protein